VGSQPQRVIVTRPAQEAAHWVDELTRSGFNAQAFPLIDIGPVTDPAVGERLRDAWRDLSACAACMFVSGNAAQYFFQGDQAEAQSSQGQPAIESRAEKMLSKFSNSLPSGLRFLAPGPGTAAALLALGVPAAQIDSPPPEGGQFDSEALWQVIGQRDWRGARVLMLRGQSSDKADQTGTGRDWLAQQLLAAGARVETLSVYRRSAPQFTDSQVELAQIASRDGSVWLFSSSEALANLMAQPRMLGAARVDWRDAYAIATHPRIAQALRAAGWGVVRESRPAFADIVQALRSIESEIHE
jgi:uroporphyrinogen-III synthase